MIDAKKVKEFIENKNHIELTPMQYQILKAIMHGDEVFTTRGIGRSLLCYTSLYLAVAIIEFRQSEAIKTAKVILGTSNE